MEKSCGAFALEIRMRLSVDSRDPGYQAWAALGPQGSRVRVLVNGVEQTHCITADEELGYALVYETDAEGRLAHDGALIQSKELRGYVRILIEDADDHAPKVGAVNG